MGNPLFFDLTRYLAATGYYERDYADRVNAARQARAENPLGCPRWDRCAKRWVAHESRRGRRIRQLHPGRGVQWCQRCLPDAQRLPLAKCRKS